MTDPYDPEKIIATQQMGGFSKTSEKWLKYGSHGIIPVVRAQGGGPDIEIPESFMEDSSDFSEPFSRLNYRYRIHKPWTKEWTEIVDEYKMSIKQKYIQHKDQHLLFGEKASLGDLYTEPDIIQKSKSGGFRNVCVNELLGSKAPWHKPVILHGASGSGKSVIAQKIMLDWASGKCYLNFHLVFYLKYEELKCISEEMNLFELLSWRSNLPSHVISQMILQSSCNVLFLIDGFDECRLLYHEYSMLHVSKKAPPEVIVCALLRGEILLSSTLLVTTRTEVIQGTMLKRPQRFTKIVGFSEKKIKEYFQKFFQDEKLFRKVFESVKSNETLLTACSIPVICWIICTVIRERFNDGADITSGLETTTSIYVDFVFTLLEHHSQSLNQSVPNLLMSLGQLAERGMFKQQVLFDEKIINETVQDPACCPFLCKFLFKRRIQQDTMFSFMHLSFQEFFSALYYVCLDKNQAMMKLTKLCYIRESIIFYYPPRSSDVVKPPNFSDVVKFAFGLLNKDLQCTLIKHGLSIHQNVEAHLKQWFINEICNRPCFLDPIVFNYLYELHEKSFVEEAMQTCNQIYIRCSILRRTDCWALLYCAQCFHSVRSLSVIDCDLTPDKLSIILPVVHKFKSLCLNVENPTDSDLVDLMCAFTRGKTQRVDVSCVRDGPADEHCSVESLELSVSDDVSSLNVENPTDSDLVALMWAAKAEKIRRVFVSCARDGPADEHCSVKSLELSVNDDVSSVRLEFDSGVVRTLRLTLPQSEAIDWAKLFQIFHKTDLDVFTYVIYSLPKLKTLELKVDSLNESLSLWSLFISQNVSSLTELKINANFLLEEGIEIFRRSHTRPNCTLTFEGVRCNKPSQKCTRGELPDPELSCNQFV